MKTQAARKPAREAPRRHAVKIGTSRQVVIPKPIHDQLRLAPGDFLEVEVRAGKVVFTPKTLVDRGIEEGLEDIRKGRVHGPFRSAKGLVAALRGEKKAPRSA
jgi:AbrB family looped-hinge helix DNA binding protein